MVLRNITYAALAINDLGAPADIIQRLLLAGAAPTFYLVQFPNGSILTPAAARDETDTS